MFLISVRNYPYIPTEHPVFVHAGRLALAGEIRMAAAKVTGNTRDGAGIVVTLDGPNEFTLLEDREGKKNPIVIIVEAIDAEHDPKRVGESLLAACKKVYPSWPATVHFRAFLAPGYQPFRATISAR